MQYLSVKSVSNRYEIGVSTVWLRKARQTLNPLNYTALLHAGDSKTRAVRERASAEA